MSKHIMSKGAVLSQLKGLKSISFHLSLFEVIDNRKHSNSKKVFVDFNKHNSKCIIGYSESATKEDIKNTVDWFSGDKSHNDKDNIATTGVGYKIFIFKMDGEWRSITKIDNLYYFTDINTSNIKKMLMDDTINQEVFSQGMDENTSSIKSNDEVYKTEENIFNNDNLEYPFTPNTIFYGKNIDMTKPFEEYKDGNGYNFEDLIKRLRIKYYDEISNGLELYIKFPDTSWKQITNDDSRDIIGTTNKTNDLTIEIFINDDYYYGYIFRINKNLYKFSKNGNSTLREKINDNITTEPDYILTLFTNELPTNDIKNYIVGNSIEQKYSGMYISIGDSYINGEAVKWDIDKRNLYKSSKFRCVLKCNTQESKKNLKTSGLKSEFDLTTMNNFHAVIHACCLIHKKYNNIDNPTIPDEYVLVPGSNPNKKSKEGKSREGYFYVAMVGENFFKLGYCTNRERIWQYGNKGTITSCKKDFPRITIYSDPSLVFLTLYKIKNVQQFEEEIKTVLIENHKKAICTTYDKLKGDDIREYFYTKSWYIIKKEIDDTIKTYR